MSSVSRSRQFGRTSLLLVLCVASLAGCAAGRTETGAVSCRGEVFPINNPQSAAATRAEVR
jgi:hypothetical protein